MIHAVCSNEGGKCGDVDVCLDCPNIGRAALHAGQARLRMD